MPNRNTKPGALNQQERPGKYVATSFRLTPTDLRIADRLCALGGEVGEPIGRAELLRSLLRAEFRRRFPGEPFPTEQGPKPSAKGKPKGKRKP